jgi:hypothetical protein
LNEIKENPNKWEKRFYLVQQHAEEVDSSGQLKLVFIPWDVYTQTSTVRCEHLHVLQYKGRLLPPPHKTARGIKEDGVRIRKSWPFYPSFVHSFIHSTLDIRPRARWVDRLPRCTRAGTSLGQSSANK